MTRRKAEPRCLAFALAACAFGVQAQQGAAQLGGVTVRPRINVMQTWTDNLRLESQNQDAALITTLSPGISVVSNSGALRGSLDYSLNGIAYIKSDQPSRVENSLSANGRAELISGSLYVDVRASIGQQNASAFSAPIAPTLGSQGAVNGLANANRHETGTLAVSPSLRGVLGGLATYDLRGDLTRTEARGTSLGDSRGGGISLGLSGLNGGALNWWTQVNSQRIKAKTAPSNGTTSLRVGLSYRPDPDWAFAANVGRELNDYLGSGTRNGATRGFTVDWTPTPRTRIGANWQGHAYGDSHGLNFQHRFARMVWRLADTQTTTLGNTGASGGVRSNYDMFFLLFASQEPDPIKRDVLVRAYLQAQGLSPDAPVSSGFLSTGPSRLRNQQLAVTLQGVRASVSAMVNRTVTRRLGDNLNQGDLANSSQIEQRSFSLTASHQLTPTSGISLSLTRQESAGDLGSQSMQLTSMTANWNARLGLWLNAQLGARHSRFEGVMPYTENAVYAGLTQQF